MTTQQAVERNIRTRRSSNASKHPHTFSPVPLPTQQRLDASLRDHAFDLDNRRLSKSDITAAAEKKQTVLYLAYGSNLCKETFRGVRGIRPLSQITVLVPELRLTFDLPGFPYSEPCFANSARRNPENDTPEKAKRREYHKDRWHKPMVGCVYEVTFSDYARIIATEGGGASYQDILVTCYPLDPNAEAVPQTPTTAPFKAHTLFAPAVDRSKGGYSRPDPSYAQPSGRYLKLITDGADELDLPQEYKNYLHEIRPYTITTKRQAMGKAVFMAIWMPLIMLIFTLNKKLSDDQGQVPKWLAWLSGMVFKTMWTTYDAFWKHVFGDGERTIGQGQDVKDIGAKLPLDVLSEEEEEEIGNLAWAGVGITGGGEKERLLV